MSDYQVNESQVVLRETPSFLLRFIINVVALAVAANFIDDIYFSSIFYLLLAGLLLTIFNSIVKPLLILLTLPLTILTFGLFYPIVNVMVINLVDFFLEGFVITGILNALIFSIIVALLNYAVTALSRGGRQNHSDKQQRDNVIDYEDYN